MKKILASLFLSTSLFLSLTVQTSAITVFCTNCSEIFTQLKDMVEQTAQTYSGAITATQQTLETVNNTILIPARDIASLLVLIQSGKNIQNLILGSLGVDPLLVRNPDQYFKTKAMSALNLSYSDLAPLKSIYGESLLSYMIAGSRQNYADYPTKLKNITQSSVPYIVQKNACSDATLSQLAREDVSVPGQPLDQAKYAARKKQFFESFCVRDPAKDPATAQALRALQSSRPNIGGWDSFLAVTSGDNQYNTGVNLQLTIEERVKEVVERAKNDYNLGGGIKSLTECKKYAENDINGNLYSETATAPCALEEIKQISSVLASTYKEAIEMPMKLLQSAFGTGAGSLVSTAFTTLNLLNGINTSLSSLNSGGGGAGSTVYAPPVQDLEGNPAGKQTISSPINDFLDMHANAANRIEKSNKSLFEEIEKAEQIATEVRSCYQGLITSQITVDGDFRVQKAYAYSSKIANTTTSYRAAISKDESKIAAARTLIADFRQKLKNSQSSSEISALFQKFQDEVKSGSVPGQELMMEREQMAGQLRGENTITVMDGGDAFALNQECLTIRRNWEMSQGAP